MWEAEFKRSSYLQVMSGDTRRLCEVLGQHVLSGPQFGTIFCHRWLGAKLRPRLCVSAQARRGQFQGAAGEFPLWVNNVINHPFGNGLYVYTTSLWWWLGDGLWWFTIVLPCFTHMIYPFTSFSLVLFVNSRIKAQRAGWHCQCLRMSQIFDLWRSRGSEADGSCYSALTAWSWPKPQLKSCRVRRQKAPKGALMLSGCQVQESHPVVLLWRDYSPCLAHLSLFSPARLQAWSWLCVWNQAFASRRSQTSASAGCSKICTCSLACHYLSSTRRDPVSIHLMYHRRLDIPQLKLSVSKDVSRAKSKSVEPLPRGRLQTVANSVQSMVWRT